MDMSIDEKLRHGIIGRRVQLRRRQGLHAPYLRSIQDSPEFLRAMFRFETHFPKSVDELAGNFNIESGTPIVQSRAAHYVVESKTDGLPIGIVSYVNFFPEHRRAELTFGLTNASPSIAVEAGVLAILFAFGVLGLNKLEARVFSDNPKFIAMDKRFGFREEGLIADHFLDSS